MSIPEEQVKGIAHRTIREADTDGDKLISFDEFKEVLLQYNPVQFLRGSNF